MIATLAATACGGRSGSQPPASGDGIAVDAAEFVFRPAQVTAAGGQVTFRVRNSGQIAHNFKIVGQNAGVETIEPGQTATVTATLPPGTYEFVCDIPGHMEAGMRGTLTVGE